MEPRFIFEMGEAAHFIFHIQVNISECEYQKKARRFVERFIMNLISKALRWHVLKEWHLPPTRLSTNVISHPAFFTSPAAKRHNTLAGTHFSSHRG